MNDHALPPLGVNFTISNRPASITAWAAGASVNGRATHDDLRDPVEGVSGEGPPASGPNQEDYRVRCQAIIGNGARGTLAGLVEALRCAFGKSKDRAFGNYVMQRRKQIQDHCEVVLQKTL